MAKKEHAMCYQKFFGEGEPKPPFKIEILAERDIRWYVKYKLTNGEPMERWINSATASKSTVKK